MPDEVMPAQTKPAEMSFSDWKKLKSALGNSVDNKVSQKDDLKRGKQNTKPNNNYTKKNNNNDNNYKDYRNPQSLLYFEYLKRNNLRVFGGNAGTFPMFNSLPISTMDSNFNNSGQLRNMNLSCNFPQNNIGHFSNMDSSCNFPQNNVGNLRNMDSSCNFPQNNIGNLRNMDSSCNFPQNNIGNLRNMDSSCNFPQKNIGHLRNMDSGCNFPQNNGGTNFQDIQTTSSDFVMSNGGIPQQPFRKTHSNSGDKYTFKRNTTTFRNQRQPISINKKSMEVKQSNVMKTAPAFKSDEAIKTSPKHEVKNSITKAKKQPWVSKKPKPPTSNEKPPESKEEKQRMWREYRQKMKPFKNREFHNAKRVIQRLGKKNFDELDDKEKERFTRAKETVAAHKNKLADKAANRWTIINETDSAGQSKSVVYVAKPKQTRSDNPVTVPVPANITPPNDSGLDDSSNSVKTKSNYYDLWNNFIPEGIVLNSTGN